MDRRKEDAESGVKNEMNIYEAIASIMQKGYAIGKEKKNVQQGFKYRGIDDVMNTFQPLMADAGIFAVPEVLEHEREERATKNGGQLIYSIMKVRYTFYASDGTSISATVIGEGMDSADKSSNKAMAVAMKYAMFQTFCIPTEEMANDDPDKTTPEASKPAEPKPAAPKPAEPAEPKPAEPLKFCCEKCGKGLIPYTGANGKQVGLRQHAEGSKKKFGQVLCLDCINELNASGNN